MENKIHCDKVGYPSRDAARSAIQGIHRSGRGGNNKPKESYLCSHCNEWHISTQEKKKLKVNKKFITLAEIKLRKNTNAEKDRIWKKFK